MTPGRILAIDPGTRYMGIAVLVGTDLIRADVESIREPGMRGDEIVRKTERIVRRWIDRYRPEVLAIEDTSFAQSKQSRHLKRIMNAITVAARREGLTVQTYHPMAVRRSVCRKGRPTRLAVARVIATERFPWLEPYYQREARKSWWRKHYWTHLFDAVAVGLTCAGAVPARRARRRAA